MVVFYSSDRVIINVWNEAFRTLKTMTCSFSHETELDDFLQKNDTSMLLFVDTRNRTIPQIERLLVSLREQYSFVHVVIFSAMPTYEEGSKWLALGIKAYGNVHMAPIHLHEIYHSVSEGNIWLYPEFIQTMIRTFNTQKTMTPASHPLLKRLTQKEQEVALLLKKGLSNKEIALHVGITERTVKAHLSSIFEKTGAKDRLALALIL
ncbi:MAG: response regulator transcription factor [Sulfurospirillum cavolei]|nr:response regulator transcription factor [Sulfurospirillum cavolei]